MSATTEIKNSTNDVLSTIQASSSLRENAKAIVAQLGLPASKNEEYRFAPVTKVLEKNFNLASSQNPKSEISDISSFVIEGLDAQRIFYSTRYVGAAKESKAYDGRAAIYWNPAIRTDQNGEAKVEFYTGDRQTEMEVIVNGIELCNGNTGEQKTVIKANLNK
jgi:hypothetical protein